MFHQSSRNKYTNLAEINIQLRLWDSVDLLTSKRRNTNNIITHCIRHYVLSYISANTTQILSRGLFLNTMGHSPKSNLRSDSIPYLDATYIFIGVYNFEISNPVLRSNIHKIIKDYFIFLCIAYIYFTLGRQS